MRILGKDQHFTQEREWLKTTHHFSFGEYYDPNRMGFGPLRVFNDDTILPASGFDFHQHKDMEIVTYVIDGTLEHKDNFGNRGIVQPGEIQTMSAGTGVFHSEYNHSDTESLRLLQMWIFADTKNLKPSWGQQKFTKDERKNRLLPVITPDGKGKSLSIHQDVSFFVSRIESSNNVKHHLGKGRQAYLYVIKGGITANGESLQEGDSAEISDPELRIAASDDSEIILIDLPAVYSKNSEPS